MTPAAWFRRGLAAIDGALALIVVLLMVQMWLLTATLNAYLAGRTEVLWPGAVFSGVCLGGVRRLVSPRGPYGEAE